MSQTLFPAAPPLGSTPYVMPVVRVGTTVNWWPFAETDKNDPLNKPLPAMVTAVGSRTLQIHVFSPLSKTLAYKDGVRHAGDPDARRDEFVEVGAWSHTEETHRLDLLEKRVVYLAEVIASMKPEKKLKGD